jgi:chemotaxis protein CheZ
MKSQDQFLQEIMDNVTRQVVDGIKDTLTRTVEKELTGSLTKALVESEFYRKLSTDMRGGLQSIYKEIALATRPEAQAEAAAEAAVQAVGTDAGQADRLFHEASQQLDEILVTTEEATTEIMDVVEHHMELQNKAQDLLKGLRKTRKSNPAIHELIKINDELGDNLIRIMTSLSFQDLTGQRIKKIINALKKIEHVVFDLYMSTGLIIKAREEAPDKDIAQLEEEAHQKVSKLKGPSADAASQGEVDDLLSQLGLD